MKAFPERGNGDWKRLGITVILGLMTIISTWALAGWNARRGADHELIGRVTNLEKIDSAQAVEIGLSTRYRENHQQETTRMYSELKSEVAALKAGQDEILRVLAKIERRTR